MNGTPGTWRIETRAFSLLSAQRYGLSALVMLKKADLAVSGSISPMVESSGNQDFYLYSTLTNNGFAAPGSYVQLQLPDATAFSVEGARIYSTDGRSHFYDATELYYDETGRNWHVATGEIINGFPRVVRWHVRYTGTGCPSASLNLQTYYQDAEATVSGGSASVPFACQQTTQQTIYLPLIVK